MADVSGVTKHWITAQEGFTTTTSGSVTSGAATVGLNSVTGYANGDQVALVIDPTDATKKQVFTGTVDASGVQIINVVWTEGTNQTHSAGVTVVDYETATAWAAHAKGMKVEHNQDGTHGAITSTNAVLTTPKVITSLNDTNNNEVFKIGATASAVNEITITNAATGNAPQVSSTGGDTNIDLKFAPKGTGKLTGVVENMKNPYKFSVYRAAALNSSSAFTVIAFETKEFDTGNNVDVTTNKGRFTAPVAGFYTFSAVAGNTAATNTQMGTQLWKNGSAFKNGLILDPSLNVGTFLPSTWFVQLAAGDYVEIAFIGGNGSVMAVGAANCWFTGYLVSAG